VNAGPRSYFRESFDGQTPNSDPGGGALPSVGVTWPNSRANGGGYAIGSVPDGTSNTIMFGELRIGTRPGDRRGTWALGHPGASILAGGGEGDCSGPNDGTRTRFENCDDIHGGLQRPGPRDGCVVQL
jgi:hypothetical protein